MKLASGWFASWSWMLSASGLLVVMSVLLNRWFHFLLQMTLHYETGHQNMAPGSSELISASFGLREKWDTSSFQVQNPGERLKLAGFGFYAHPLDSMPIPMPDHETRPEKYCDRLILLICATRWYKNRCFIRRHDRWENRCKLLFQHVFATAGCSCSWWADTHGSRHF